MNAQTIKTDIVIIGAGPVGLFAVFEAGLLGMSCHLIDNLDREGGQCTELYPEKPIFDIPAIPHCTGQELIDRLMEQARPFEPVFHFNQMAESIEKLENGWRLRTGEGTVFETPNVVIAAGAGSFVPRRIPIPNADQFENRSLFYSVRKVEMFRDKRVLIAGGGDSALDWLINLEPTASNVTLIHRRDEFRAAPDSVAKMRALQDAGKITFHIGQIKELNGSDGQLESVGIQTKEGKSNIEIDMLLGFYGLKAELGPIAEWGLNIDRNHIEVDTQTYETNVPGLFAIGDIATYPGKLKLILSGFHEAALMCQRAHERAFPDKKLVFRYTTSSATLHEKLGLS